MKEPTNGELKIMLDNLEEKSAEKHKDLMASMQDMKGDVRETLLQARATNGRVNRHELYFKILWWSLGALASFTVFSFPYLRQVVEIQTKETVNTAISEHDAKIKEETAASIAGILSKYDINVSQ